MEINVSTLIWFLIKFVLIIVLIWVMAVLTPKIAKFIDEKKKKNSKSDNLRDDNIYKTDVFGASYKEDVEAKKKKNKKN
jgi:hypothetical protein